MNMLSRVKASSKSLFKIIDVYLLCTKTKTARDWRLFFHAALIIADYKKMVSSILPGSLIWSIWIYYLL